MIRNQIFARGARAIVLVAALAVPAVLAQPAAAVTELVTGIRGTVTLDGVPFEGAGVIACSGSPCFTPPVATNASGEYELTGLTAGVEYQVRATPPGGPAGTSFEVTIEDVVLADGEVRTLDLALDPGGTVSGDVTGPDGAPVVGANISAGPTSFVTSDAAGRYSARTASNDNGVVTVIPPPGSGLAPARVDGVVVPTHGAVEVDIQLELGVTIVGRVTDADGNPIPLFPFGPFGPTGPVVVTCPSPPTQFGCPFPPSLSMGRTHADANGDFRLGEVSAGTHYVRAIDIRTFPGAVSDVASVTLEPGETAVCEIQVPGPATCTLAAGDDDGVPDEVEDGAPNGGDGNNDGTPDSQQAHVTSLPSAVAGNPYVTLAAPDGTMLVNVEAIDPSALPLPPGGHTLPVGVLSFEVHGVAVGSTVAVDVYTPSGTTLDSYLKFQDGDWVDFTANASFAANIVTLSLTDGGFGDADGEANGIIVDPGAPALATDAEVEEGDHGLRGVEVTVELASRTDPKKVRIDYCTEDGSAVGGDDYRADCRPVILNRFESSARIKLMVRGDQLVEGDEDFFVNLTADGGTLVDDRLRILIRDDD